MIPVTTSVTGCFGCVLIFVSRVTIARLGLSGSSWAKSISLPSFFNTYCCLNLTAQCAQLWTLRMVNFDFSWMSIRIVRAARNYELLLQTINFGRQVHLCIVRSSHRNSGPRCSALGQRLGQFSGHFQIRCQNWIVFKLKGGDRDCIFIFEPVNSFVLRANHVCYVIFSGRMKWHRSKFSLRFQT